jgi:predicted RNase H-like nuclease (RuvC/YqgF family)
VGYIRANGLRERVTTRTIRARDRPVFGVDVHSGDVRGDDPSYALVILDPVDEDDPDAPDADGPMARVTRDVVSFRKLCRLIDDREPLYVATDNAYELAADKNDLVGFLRSLPDGTRLVQVTGAERPEPLSRVASRHGIPYGKEPMKEAEASARLAAANVGHEVTAFTDETRVKVSRGRSTGKGGWSQDRYTRRIHGNVRKRTRQVQSKLNDANLEFERDVTEKYGGYANATFTVEARPEDIPVSNSRAGDVRVEVERERRDGIEYEPLVKRRDRVIVGIDPGTTTAAAVVGLDGTVHALYSSRTADTADVTEWIIEQGRPIIVAADVEPMPETVEKFRRSFDAAGWRPTTDLPVDEKLHRTRETNYDNDHERDALAAALYAYDDHEDQFDRIAAKTPPRLDREAVIAGVVAGGASVESVVAELSEDDGGESGGGAADEEESDPTEPERTEEEETIRRLRERVERLESHAESLEDDLDERDDRIAELESELEEARREERIEARARRAVSRLERETDRLERERDEARETVAELEGKVETLKELWRLDHSNFDDVAADRGLVSVKVVEQFTLDALDAADEAYGLVAGDVVYLRDASGAGRRTAERLAETDPRAVIRDGNLSDVADQVLFDHEVPVVPADAVPVREVDELAVASEGKLEAALDDWERRAERRRKAEKQEHLDRIISEHRAGRTLPETEE